MREVQTILSKSRKEVAVGNVLALATVHYGNQNPVIMKSKIKHRMRCHNNSKRVKILKFGFHRSARPGSGFIRNSTLAQLGGGPILKGMQLKSGFIPVLLFYD